MTQPAPKDAWNGVCGIMFQSGGFDHQINMLQVAICLMTAPNLNPFFQLFG